MTFWGPAVLATPGAGRASDQAYAHLALMLSTEGWTLLGENTTTRPGWHAYVWQCPVDNLLRDSFQVIVYRPVETCMENSRVQGLELEAVSDVVISTLTAYRYNRHIVGLQSTPASQDAPYRWSTTKIVLDSNTLDLVYGYARGFLWTIPGAEYWLLVTKDQIYWGGAVVGKGGAWPLNVGFVGNMQPAVALEEYLDWVGAAKLPLLVNYGAGAHLSPWFYGVTESLYRGTNDISNSATPLKGNYSGFWSATSGRDKHELDQTTGVTPLGGGALAAPELSQLVHYGAVSLTSHIVETPQYLVPNLLRAYVAPADTGFPLARQGGIIDVSAPELDAVNVYPVSGRYMLCETPSNQTVSPLSTSLHTTLVRTGPIPPVV